MTESNNVVSLSDWKNKKDPNTKKQLEEARETIKKVKIDELEGQSLPEDHYKSFVTDPVNANKIQFTIDETIKAISLQFPEIITCRFGDVLFLKEAIVSLIMRSALNQDHPFQIMADKLEITFNGRMNDDSTK